MNRFEIAEDLRNKPVGQLVKFKAIRNYYADGYKLSHSGIWHLTYKNKYIMSEKDVNFWQIISMYDFKPFEITDEIGTDLHPIDFIPPDRDTSFTPSLGIDYGYSEAIERPFPIWQWNEYIDPQLMDKYKVN